MLKTLSHPPTHMINNEHSLTMGNVKGEGGGERERWRRAEGKNRGLDGHWPHQANETPTLNAYLEAKYIPLSLHLLLKRYPKHGPARARASPQKHTLSCDFLYAHDHSFLPKWPPRHWLLVLQS